MRHLLACLLLLTCVSLEAAADHSKTASGAMSDERMEELVQGTLKAPYPHQARARYARLFKEAGSEGIRKLKLHPNAGAALRAAWEEVRLTLPEEEQHRAVRPDPQRLQRFIGFVEGRLPVEAPDWWVKTLPEAQCYKRG